MQYCSIIRMLWHYQMAVLKLSGAIIPSLGAIMKCSDDNNDIHLKNSFYLLKLTIKKFDKLNDGKSYFIKQKNCE